MIKKLRGADTDRAAALCRTSEVSAVYGQVNVCSAREFFGAFDSVPSGKRPEGHFFTCFSKIKRQDTLYL